MSRQWLPRPRFGLRALFVLTTVVAATCGTLHSGRSRYQQHMQEIAELVEQLNCALDAGRYSDASAVANHAVIVDPDDPIVVQMRFMAKVANRATQSISISFNERSECVMSSTCAIDESSIPFCGGRSQK